MNRASLLSRSPCSVWVTVQILPVIREPSLKQPPSLSIPAFQVRGNVRPNTHQGVLSLFLSLSFLSEPVGRGASFAERPSLCRSHTQHFKTYPLWTFTFKRRDLKVFLLYQRRRRWMHAFAHYFMHSCMCVCGRHRCTPKGSSYNSYPYPTQRHALL